MSNEWKELNTILDVAAAKTAGMEIMWTHPEQLQDWHNWCGKTWAQDMRYRARPSKPAMKKVYMFAYFNGKSLLWDTAKPETYAHLKRVPAEDKEIEVEA